ncbi:tyrosine-type recombinase/integrase [Bacillus massiliigorillae]|uniref:tyrosine-type recombinase/integrase n=1 Tax=Bacillus massiliigorillae TaxID=1243664 RepID=UPI0003999A6E|nr:tyrosine-type recombinase/integrase [Bacillus massiliigorillae]
MLYSENFDLPALEIKFLRYLKSKGKPESTITAYKKDLKSFKQFIYTEYDGKFLFEQLTQSDVEDYLGYLVLDRKLKQSTANRHLSTLKSFARFLVSSQGYKENIPTKIEHERVKSPLPKILTEDELTILLNTAQEMSTYYYTIIATIYNTLSRITAIVELKKENVNLEERKIFLPYIKGGRNQFLPINDKLFVILSKFLNEHPAHSSSFLFHSPKNITEHITSDIVRKKLHEITATAGIEKRVTPHLLRHTAATFLTERGISQKALAEIMGHTDTRSTDVYQHLTLQNLREPINMLP